MNNQQPSIDTNILPKRGFGFIYCYTSPSGKRYIGQTIQSISARAKSVNGKGYRRCPVFYKAIQKYGLENFYLEILEEAPIDLINEKEQEWIKFYNTQIPNGYNISEGGSSNSKPVYQYKADTGELIAGFNSLTEAARVNKLNTIQYISDCIHGRRKTAHGYIWDIHKYTKVEPQEYYPNKPISIYAYNLNGTFYKKFNSIASAAKEIQCGRSDIKKVIQGKLNYAGGYIWTKQYKDSVKPITTFQNGSRPVAQINMQTGKIIKIFGSQSKAAKILGLSRPTGISKCCMGKQNSCAGYRWEFYEGSTTINSKS